MATYILVDTQNLFMRAKHAVGGKDLDMKLGMCLHVMFHSIKNVWKKFDSDHVVFCTEGRSWRKNFYEPYKQNRKTLQAQKTPKEQEDDAIFYEVYQDFLSFIDEYTNSTILRCPNAEADDMIALWIEQHPEDNHIIISTDSDFVQLLADNVIIYNGVTDTTFYHDHVENSKGQRVAFSVKNDGKIKVEKPDPDFEPDEDWIEWALFLKCIRGDKGDNIFSAYPGARMKGTKNKIGITEAFQDRKIGGFAYNNFMLQSWTDHEDQEWTVREAYQRNKELIDLREQPEEVVDECMEYIQEAKNRDHVSSVSIGFNFMKFCGKYDLANVSKFTQEFGQIFNSKL